MTRGQAARSGSTLHSKVCSKMANTEPRLSLLQCSSLQARCSATMESRAMRRMAL